MDQLHRHLLRLPAGGAVADGDVLHMVPPDHGPQPGDGLLLLPLAIGGVHHRGIQHLAGGVDDRHLAAVGIAGVQPHGDVALHRRLHQQGLQVQGKGLDGPLAGPLRQVAAGLPLQRGIDEPVIGVLAGALDKLHGRRAGLDHRPAQGGESCLPLQQHGNGEEALLLTPVDS